MPDNAPVAASRYSNLPDVLVEALETMKVRDENGGEIELNASVSLEESLQLYTWVRECRPEVSVEVGCAMGISSMAILQACEDNGLGRHVVIDPYQTAHWSNLGVTQVARAGLDGRMEFHEAFPDEVVPTLDRIDLAFIDGSHLFDFTMAEFVMVDRKLRVGGTVGFHDMWMPAIRSVLRFILHNRPYELVSATRPLRHPGRWAKKAIGSVVSAIPNADRLFAGEFLRPMSEQETGNLVVIRKKAEDQRDTRDFNWF